MTLDAALSVVIQSTPPAHHAKHSKRRIATHSTPGKRFSVRDGFHLHDRNQELKESIDRRLFPPAAASPLEEAQEVREQPNACLILDVDGPRVEQLPGRLGQGQVAAGSPADAGDSRSALAQVRRGDTSDRIDRIASILDRISMVEAERPRSPHQVQRDRTARDSSAACHSDSSDTTASDASSLSSSAEWLIYRHRPNVASQWQQVKMEKLLRNTLQEDERQLNDALPPSKPDAPCVLVPRPRHQSTLGSTYAERVAAARQQRQQNSSGGRRPDLSSRAIVGASVTENERRLVHSREENNKDAHRLLLSILQAPAPPARAAGPAAATPHEHPPSTTRFSTRRSELREQTAAALKSRSLRSRVDELRSLPDLIAKIESIHRLKYQQLVQEHGQDLVLKNRRQARLSVLQRPAETPLFPSALDQKLQLATKRKKELDEAQAAAARDALSRWQKRRRQQQELHARRFRESQWLLVVMLARSSVKWLKAFHLFKKKRDALNKVHMAKRIQHCWRQNALVRQNSLALLRFAPQTPLTSPFYRMPVVIKAIRGVQRFIRRWLDNKRLSARRHAAFVIVTSWFEFQDVKFRRLILRFRKRVRDFQIMWREWRAITDARVKLLLLVWAKLEKKTRRRHGLTTPLSDAAGSGAHNSNWSPRQPTQEEPRALTLVEYFRRANDRNAAGGGAHHATTREQKRLEGVHRHLRNCGTVQAPIVEVVAAAGSGSNSLAVGPTAPSPAFPASMAAATSQPPSPTKPQPPPPAAMVVKRNMQLVQTMGEEFQLAMYDYYTTAKAPKASSGGAQGSSSTCTGSSPIKAPAHLEEGKQSPPQPKHVKMSAPSSPSTRGKPKDTSSPVIQAPLANILASVSGGPRPNEKVSLQLKMTALRQLLSDKRQQFRETRERKRQEWTADRQHKRRVEFRYNVLDELAAFQRFQAENKVFLLLHSVSEADIMRLIHHTQQQANDAAHPPSSVSRAPPGAPSRRNSQQAPFRGRRSSSVSSRGGPDAASITPAGKTHSIIAVGGARLERFDDDDEQTRSEQPQPQ